MPEAISFSTRPRGVTSITASSVTIRLTTFKPVNGSVHRVRILCPPSRVVCSIATMTFLAPATRIHGAAHALHHLAGDHPVREIALLVDLQRAEDREVDVAAAHHRERVGAAEVRQPGVSVTVSLPALMRSGSTSSSRGYGPTPSMPFSECSVMCTPGGM